MPVLPVDRFRRRRKRRVSERADRNSDCLRLALWFPKDCCAAVRTKVKSHRMSAVRTASEGLGFARRCNILAGEECRDAKGAARAPLAFKTMAERNCRWLSHTAHGDLPTSARSKSRCHRRLLYLPANNRYVGRLRAPSPSPHERGRARHR